jgi:hypothetical protein
MFTISARPLTPVAMGPCFRRDDDVGRHAFAFPRRDARPGCACLFRPKEGAGNAGRPMRPIAACAMVVVERTRVSQVTPESPGIPRAMVYGLFRALPGDRAFLPPSPAKVAFRELDASVGASGPHVFAVRFSAVRYRRIRVHRIPPRVRDDREPPLQRGGTANH